MVMETAVRKAREQGCYKVMLYTGRDEPAVHSFYQGLGFSATGKTAYVVRL